MNFNLLDNSNIESYFNGYKITKGKNTKIPCLTLGVSKKLPKSKIPKEEFIPNNIRGIPTDVIEVPKMFAFACSGSGLVPPSKNYTYGCPGHSYDNNAEPFECFPAGSSIGPKDDFTAGTLGFFALDNSGDLVGVTNNHVLGNHIYSPKHQTSITYNVSALNENTFNFYNTKTKVNYTNPSFDGKDSPIFEADRVYKFVGHSNLNAYPLLISNIDSHKIYNQGSIIFENNSEVHNSGRDACYIRQGETIEFIYKTEENKKYTKPYYSNYINKTIINNINFIFFGVPHCFSDDRFYDYSQDYVKAELKQANLQTEGLQCLSPSNIDANSPLGLGQKEIGRVKQSCPLNFYHQYNSSKNNNSGTFPSNLIDASIVKLNNNAQASLNTLDLLSFPPKIGISKPNGVVSKSGRTTGNTNGARIISNNWYGYVYYCNPYYRDDTGDVKMSPSRQHAALFNDVIYYRTEGEWFSDSGDSGSGLFMEESDGSKSLIGLHFAGFTSAERDSNGEIKILSHGLACKIEHVMSYFNLSPWDGSKKVSSKLLSEGKINICGRNFVVAK